VSYTKAELAAAVNAEVTRIAHSITKPLPCDHTIADLVLTGGFNGRPPVTKCRACLTALHEWERNSER